MRGPMLQTPLKDQNSATRRTKSNLDHKRNITKVLKKSLDHEFKSVVEENGTDLESSEVISGDCAFDESVENVNSFPSLLDTPGSETVAVSELTSASSTVTTEAFGALNNKSEIPGTGSSETIGSIEAEMVITFLREARGRLSKSKSLGHSKRLLDALATALIEEFSDDKYEKKGCLNKLLSSNIDLLFLVCMLWSLALAVFVSFLSLGSNGFPGGLPPT